VLEGTSGEDDAKDAKNTSDAWRRNFILDDFWRLRKGENPINVQRQKVFSVRGLKVYEYYIKG
jgi:hypothetical protein